MKRQTRRAIITSRYAAFPERMCPYLPGAFLALGNFWLLPAAAPSGSPAQEFECNTFSIVAFDPEAKQWGCAVASKYLSVGRAVPWGKAGVGIVATQAQVNLNHGPNAVELLTKGFSAPEVLKAFQESDSGIESRQLGIVDAKGNAVSFTGKKCTAWAGGKTGQHYAIQGNILVGEVVVNEMAKAFEDAKGALVWRLMAALEAGDKVGGDKRGKQSAAVLVLRQDGKGTSEVSDLYRYLDYRVDDHKEPIPELVRILKMVPGLGQKKKK